ncbi:MAG: hypothetical protein IJS35_03585 [Firmicutes bacterium]|nr:hypothetical protein [Bacillota bacterium]
MMYELKEEFGNNDIERILQTEMKHIDRYCASHMIESIQKDKVRKIVKLFTEILADEDAVTVYELPKKER